MNPALLSVAVATALGFGLALGPRPAAAQAGAPEIAPGSVYMFRDLRGANSVGNGVGDLLQYGANIVGGSSGVLLSATSATGFFDAAAPCGPLSVNANFCANITAYNAARLDPWQLHFTRAGLTTTVAGPALSAAPLVPFPSSVTLSGTGLTPTISWLLPASLTPNGFRVQIFDKNDKRENGVSNIIYSAALAPTAASFSLPAHIGLSSSGSYAINLQVIETRGDQPFTGSNAQILARSSSFFDFTPLSGSLPGDIALPTIGANGVYNFQVGNVGPDHLTFIDPEVAVGYHYAIGASGPNFQSLLLPDVGDGLFTLAYSDGSGAHVSTLLQGQQFFFGQGGVSAFTITGIEPSARLDPASGTAFVTGLSFVGNGEFTGTMTPITTAVPEPQAWGLMLTGIALLVLRRRRSGAAAAPV
ncbi:MAG: PEP-CTERM sorting domain-containing protein [Burkholderiaceae bacterium]